MLNPNYYFKRTQDLASNYLNQTSDTERILLGLIYCLANMKKNTFIGKATDFIYHTFEQSLAGFFKRTFKTKPSAYSKYDLSIEISN